MPYLRQFALHFVIMAVAVEAYDKVMLWKLTHTHQQDKLKYVRIEKQTSVESLLYIDIL